MRKVVVAIALVLIASGAQASSYLRLDGVTVEPIQHRLGGVHSYAGPNLEPGVQASGADFSGANLTLASLDHANLSGGNLYTADLSSADLSFANLSGAHTLGTNFDGANLRNADLSYSGGKNTARMTNVDATNANLEYANIGGGANANFTNANFTNSSLGRSPGLGDSFTNAFTNAIFVAADLSTATIDAAADFTGATYSTGSLSNRTLFPTGFDPVARGMVLVPEPTTALLIGLGLVGMAGYRRL